MSEPAIVNAVGTANVLQFRVATDELIIDGLLSKLQMMRLVHVTGSAGSKVVQPLVFNTDPASSAYALAVRKPVVPLHYHAIVLASNNAALVLTGARVLKGAHISNDTGSRFFAKLYNKATAPVPNVDTPLLTLMVQTGQHRDIAFPDGGLDFPLGLGIAVVAEIADNDNTAIAVASAGSVDLDYA